MLAGTLQVLEEVKLTRGEVLHRFSLTFVDPSVEESFRNQHAVAHEQLTYTGYFLQLLMGATIGFAGALLGRGFKDQQCKRFTSVAMETFCQQVLGSREITTLEKFALESLNTTLASVLLTEARTGKLGRMEESSFMLIEADALMIMLVNMIWLLFITALGAAVHWRIHYRSDRLQQGARCSLSSFVTLRDLKRKRWATLASFVVYTLGLAGFCGFAVVVSSYDAFWQMRLLLWYAFLFLIGIFFTGMLFWQAVAMSVVGTACFIGCSVPILLHNRGEMTGGLTTLIEIEPVFETVVYCGTVVESLFMTALLVVSAYQNTMTTRTSFLLELMIFLKQDLILDSKTHKQKIQEDFLHKIMPPAIVEQLMSAGLDQRAPASSSTHENVCVLFADVVGFSSFAKQVDAGVVMEYLNSLFATFDILSDQYGVYKLMTIGDCYVATTGLATGLNEVEGQIVGDCSGDIAARQNTSAMLEFAKEMLIRAKHVKKGQSGATSMRVGMHTGPCKSGVVGAKNFRFCVFGEAMSTAASLEHLGQPDHVHASEVVKSMTPQEKWSKSQRSSGYLLPVEGSAILGIEPFRESQGSQQQLSIRSVDWDPDEDFDVRKATDFYLRANKTFGRSSDPSLRSKSFQSRKEVGRSHEKFKASIRCGHFRNFDMELAFINEHSVLHKNISSFIIEVVAAAILVGLDNLFYEYERTLCSPRGTGEEEEQNFYCDLLFGPPEEDKRNEFNWSMLCSMVVINIGAAACHVFVHKSRRVKNKAWSMVSANVATLMKVVILVSLMVTVHSGDNFWPVKLMVWYQVVVMTSMWLTGLMFLQNVVVFIVCVTVYLALTLNVATWLDFSVEGDEAVAEMDVVLTSSLYATTTHFIFFIHIAMLAASFVNERQLRERFFERHLVGLLQEKVIQEKTKLGELQKDLLFNFLPTRVVNQLEKMRFNLQKLNLLKEVSQRHQGVCITFAELDGFAELSAQVDPSSVLNYLSELFLVLDGLGDDHDVYKVETVGDQYVAAVGVVTGKILDRKISANTYSDRILSRLSTKKGISPRSADEDTLLDVSVFNTARMISYAKAIMRNAKEVDCPDASVQPALRIGIHTGPCMSGIVGSKNLRFCLFGDTMNTAARMVQTGRAACIHTTEDVVGLVPGEPWERLKKIEVKGKGVMQTYLMQTS
ncbi:guanylate cyclase [Chloropicon primus]|nr:guanylate cyclase [Chloropicon primus]